MSYEIKKIYKLLRQGIAGPNAGLIEPDGWFWERETCERLTAMNGNSGAATMVEWEAIVIGDDVLIAERNEDGTNTITKIVVRGSSDEELRAATFSRIPEPMKHLMGIEYDEALLEEQGGPRRKPVWYNLKNDRIMALAFELSDLEAELLGVAQEKKDAFAEFQRVMEAADELKTARSL